MRSFRVSFSNEASADVDSILHYIAKDSPVTALRFVDSLEERIVHLLSSTPLAGRRVGKARYFVFGGYIAAYLVDEDLSTVTVALIAEGHRLWRKDLEERLRS
jgi:plasmid stabilization system protein ParE